MAKKMNDIGGQQFGKWTVLSYVGGKFRKWLCKCGCGITKEVIGQQLKNGRSTRCRKCKQLEHRKDIKGHKFGRWTVIDIDYVDVGSYGHTDCLCRCDCGNTQKLRLRTLRKDRPGGCKTCASHKAPSHPMSNIFCQIRSHANYRGISFNLTIEYLWDLLYSQNFVCALTNLPIEIYNSPRELISKTTASLDRINSDKGYEVGNVQWVHKDLNIMKMDLVQDSFIQYCRLVAKKFP